MPFQSERIVNALRTLQWLPAYGWQRLTRRPLRHGVPHVLIALADHFEPAIVPGHPHAYADVTEQERRLEHWCRTYPHTVGDWRDAEGQPFRHTYFYPAEQYDKQIVARLADHCHSGWGETEIHLHHGVHTPDTASHTRQVLAEFRDALVAHGCLSQWEAGGPPQYAFVHGNWALANSAGGRLCGVDEEMQILADTGCYADCTLPAAPSRAQVAKINALYECALPLNQRAPHRKGKDLRCGQSPSLFPLIIQGPLAIGMRRQVSGWFRPYIENSALAGSLPPSMDRFRLWCRMGIVVQGRPDWLFLKLHCHGMDPQDEEVMLGEPMRCFLRELTQGGGANGAYRIHFLTVREMVNVMLAACDGREGNPGEYRDYRLRLIASGRS